MQRRDNHEYHWDAQDTSPSTLLLRAPGIPSSAPPEPPFPCTTWSVGHPVSTDHDVFLRSPSWSWLSQDRTLFCHTEGMWRFHDPKVHSVKSSLRCLLSDSRMYLWGPLEQRLYQTTRKKWWLYHQNPVLPGGVTVCVLWPITQVELPEEWDTIPNPPQKHPILSGKTRSTPQTKSRMTHASPTGNGRNTHY